jgi:multidrug efflux pump subunit AcrB
VSTESVSRRQEDREKARNVDARLGRLEHDFLFAFALVLLTMLPLLMLPGGAGQFIRSLPLAVVYTVLASLFVSLTIVPFLASRFLTGHENTEGNFLLRLLQRAIHVSSTGGSYTGAWRTGWRSWNGRAATALSSAVWERPLWWRCSAS